MIFDQKYVKFDKKNLTKYFISNPSLMFTLLYMLSACLSIKHENNPYYGRVKRLIEMYENKSKENNMHNSHEMKNSPFIEYKNKITQRKRFYEEKSNEMLKNHVENIAEESKNKQTLNNKNETTNDDCLKSISEKYYSIWVELPNEINEIIIHH
ncbi:hypothetical protein H311_01508 [Anncaliia algerae PRA109]|nr:hypothetical protein H311_01508 [Anncaliia algerae PRA109]